MELSEEAGVEFPIDVEALAERSRAYAARCDGLRIVGPLSASLSAQILCALEGWRSSEACHDLSSDPERAATHALGAIERSRQAWLALVRTREVGALYAADFVADLVWLKYELARAFPNAAT